MPPEPLLPEPPLPVPDPAPTVPELPLPDEPVDVVPLPEPGAAGGPPKLVGDPDVLVLPPPPPPHPANIRAARALEISSKVWAARPALRHCETNVVIIILPRGW